MPDMRLTALSSDSRMFVAKDNKETNVVRLWEVASGQDRLKIPVGSSNVSQLVLSPDCRLLATRVNYESVVRLWDIITGKQLHQFASGRAADYGYNHLAFASNSKTLASGNKDSTVLIWDVTPWIDKKLPETNVSPTELKLFWSTLRDIDAVKAYQAIGKLVVASDQAVPILAEQLLVVDSTLAQRVPQLIADLDSDNFQIRARAKDELQKLGVEAEPFLLKALKNGSSLEVCKSVKELLEAEEPQPGKLRPLSLLQKVRGIEVLERIGTLAACQALRKIAEERFDDEVGEEARYAFQRLHSIQETQR